MIKLECGGLSGMKSELQGFRDLSAFRHFEIGVFVECWFIEVFFLPSADRMCVLTIVEFRFIEAWMVVCCVQCAVCVWSSLMRRNTDHRSIWTTEQEQSSLYIVQNKLLISSSDSVETKEASDLFMRFWLRFNSWRCIKS